MAFERKAPAVAPKPESSVKGYVCNRFPSLSISLGGGRAARFRGGVFRTDDRDVQAAVEKNGWYGVHIHPE